MLTVSPEHRLSDPKQAFYAQEAREFLRKKLIGKHVKVNIDFIRPREGDFDERECATIQYGGQNAYVHLRNKRNLVKRNEAETCAI